MYKEKQTWISGLILREYMYEYEYMYGFGLTLLCTCSGVARIKF